MALSRGGIGLGSIFGIKITLDYSWFIIFAIVVFALGFSLFPQIIPGISITASLIIAVITAILFFGSVLAHELVHSIIAKRNGINVEGIRLILFGGVSQITGEPRTPGVEFKIAFAGPLSSVILGFIFLGIFIIAARANLGLFVTQPALWLGVINIALGIFNLLPGFPLDGGRVFRSAVWFATGSLRRATRIAAAVGRGIAYTMIFVGIAGPLFFGAFGLIWFILLGWYLLQAGRAEEQQQLYHEVLEGVKVRDIMTENPETVSPDITVEEMVDEHFSRHDWIGYPVVEDGSVVGMITLKSIEDLPRSRWRELRVLDVMRPLSSNITVGPNADVFNSLNKLVSLGEGRLLVMEDGQLVGIVTEDDVRRAIIRRQRFAGERGGRAA